ncbi:hypothetical protein FALBO_14922 [Fusarium albosuccineum]|uniref:Uncharacterized protein n=1 Tax=Fusarium albosuccineum TaxID=1237068 RepID=A0A8H4KZC6_9HYPO|nr:hypothetical protein FALBO_14922 [Fusarium albosuccineum]
MSYYRRPGASRPPYSRPQNPFRPQSGPAAYNTQDTARGDPSNGFTYRRGSVLYSDPYGEETALIDGPYTEEPSDYYDSGEADADTSYPGDGYYTNQDDEDNSYSGGNTYTRGGPYGTNPFAPRGSYAGNPFAPRNSYAASPIQGGPPAGCYWSRRSYPTYTGTPTLQQTYPSDHYAAAGNYVGPPPIEYPETASGFVSFPRYPEPEPELSLEPETSPEPERQYHSRPRRRAFTTQLVDGVRNLLSSGADSNEPQFPPQPPRTGVYLFCRHFVTDECACITPLEPDETGDYCQRCWEGRCSGPRPPGSVPRRSLLW